MTAAIAWPRRVGGRFNHHADVGLDYVRDTGHEYLPVPPYVEGHSFTGRKRVP